MRHEWWSLPLVYTLIPKWLSCRNLNAAYYISTPCSSKGKSNIFSWRKEGSRLWPHPQPSTSVLLVVGTKCTLAGSHACCPMVSMPRGQAERWTDGRTPDSYITLSVRRDLRSLDSADCQVHTNFYTWRRLWIFGRFGMQCSVNRTAESDARNKWSVCILWRPRPPAADSAFRTPSTASPVQSPDLKASRTRPPSTSTVTRSTRRSLAPSTRIGHPQSSHIDVTSSRRPACSTNDLKQTSPPRRTAATTIQRLHRHRRPSRISHSSRPPPAPTINSINRTHVGLAHLHNLVNRASDAFTSCVNQFRMLSWPCGCCCSGSLFGETVYS